MSYLTSTISPLVLEMSYLRPSERFLTLQTLLYCLAFAELRARAPRCAVLSVLGCVGGLARDALYS